MTFVRKLLNNCAIILIVLAFFTILMASPFFVVNLIIAEMYWSAAGVFVAAILSIALIATVAETF